MLGVYSVERGKKTSSGMRKYRNKERCWQIKGGTVREMKKIGRSTGRQDVWQREISKENGYSEFSVTLNTKRRLGMLRIMMET